MFWSEHTFVICAYKESIFLEACILSLLNQTVRSKIILSTSTPNEYISSLAEKYSIPIFVNRSNPSIYGDWNFGVSKVETSFFTLVHQDDVYKDNFLEEVKKAFDSSKNPLISFCDYTELRNDKEVRNSTLLRIKKLMLVPLRFKISQRSKWIRRRILSLGNPICCPAVSYSKKSLNGFLFSSQFKCDLDWDAWERLSKYDGDFLYIHKPLMSHRIHAESTTTELIQNSVRYQEDVEMFRRFWPNWIVSLLIKFYSKSQNSNSI